MIQTALYNYLETFTITGLDLLFGYKKIADNTEAPYIIQYTFNDNDPRFLCQEQGDGGQILVQYDIYSNNPQQADYIKEKLDLFLVKKNMNSLEDEEGTFFTIYQAVTNIGGIQKEMDKDLYLVTLTKTFNFNKEK